MEQFKNLHDLNINSSCRTCLQNINNLEMYHNIFAIPDLEKKFTVCTSLSADPDDGYPSGLCESCRTKIDDFYNFREMCISARKQFQDSLNSENKPQRFEFDVDSNKLPSESDLKVFTEPKQEKEENFSSNDESSEFVEANVKSQDESSSESESDDDEPIVKYRATNKDNSNNKYNISYENEDAPGDVEADDSKKSNSSSTKPNLECKICKKRFNKTDTFEVHMRVHQGLKPFACEQCDRSFVRPGRLKVHIRVMHEGEKFQCSETGCHKMLSSKQTLRQHIAEIHCDTIARNDIKGKKQTYVCEECGKVLKGLSTLKNHRFLHSGQPRPHECPQCHKRYMTRCKLKEHMNRHAGIKNFVCPHCGAKKASRSELKNHVNYHTREKTYPCHICNMVFNNIVNYSRHRRVVHEGIKNFPCSYCDKSFGKSETRKHHEMIHTGEKPHECNICHKKFIQIVSLKKHHKVHLKALGNG